MSEYPDVLLEEIQACPSPREVNFYTKLVPEVAAISKAPYRMAPVELKELNSALVTLRKGVY